MSSSLHTHGKGQQIGKIYSCGTERKDFPYVLIGIIQSSAAGSLYIELWRFYIDYCSPAAVTAVLYGRLMATRSLIYKTVLLRLAEARLLLYYNKNGQQQEEEDENQGSISRDVTNETVLSSSSGKNNIVYILLNVIPTTNPDILLLDG